MSGPKENFFYRSGKLTVDGLPLERVADTTGTPVYIYSAAALLRPLREFQAGLAGLDSVVCFAVKSNSNLSILALLSQAGAGMDLVSGGELFRAGTVGVPGENIVFSGVGKSPGEMAAALHYDEGKGIFSFNVESEPELALLSAVAVKLGLRARVALRFNPDVNPKTHPYISTGLKQNKFGISRPEILAIARGWKKYPGASLQGISVHIGSQLLSLSPLKDGFAKARELFDELGSILPEPLSFVDLGGGIGITYRTEKAPSIAQYCALIRRFFGPRSGLKHPLKILVEPGRVIAGNSGVLLTEVLYRKTRKGKDFLVVDAAMNDLIRPSLYGSHHELAPVKEIRGGKNKKTDVVGPVCESSDFFARSRPLPGSLGQGDLLAVLSAGAYGFTMASNYNSRPRVPEVLVQNGAFRVIRERETYEDLIRGENPP